MVAIGRNNRKESNEERRDWLKKDLSHCLCSSCALSTSDAFGRRRECTW